VIRTREKKIYLKEIKHNIIIVVVVIFFIKIVQTPNVIQSEKYEVYNIILYLEEYEGV